jgi:Kef-type K+ transport system membrane component KefB
MNALEIFGIAVLVGFSAARLLRLYRVPAVAAYVAMGVLLGPSVSGVFTSTTLGRMDMVSDLALGVIALTIGGELQWATIKRIARSVFPIALLESMGAMVAVTAAVQLLTRDWPLALILGAISSATAPAATVMVIRESRAQGELTSTLLAVVGIDDAIGLTLFAIASAAAKALLLGGAGFSLAGVAVDAGYEIGGALLLGIFTGLLSGPWVRRIEARDAVFALTIGVVILNAGVANHLHLSALLANMAFGAVVTNITPVSSRRLFGQMAVFAAPLFIAFFVVAGAHLRIDLLPALGLLGLVYLVARMAGKVTGAYLGALGARASAPVRSNIGFGLLSQVGVAIGLSLVVATEFGQLGGDGAGAELAVTVINVLLGTTIVTEIVGPALTRYALRRAGEIDRAEDPEERDA